MADNIGIVTVGVNLDAAGLIRQFDKAASKLKFRADTRNFEEPLGRISSSVNDFGRSLNAANARIIAFGASTLILYKVQQGFQQLIETAIDVEKRINDINVIFKLSNQGLSNFSSSVFQIARQTAQSYTAVTEAAKEYSRQGLSVEETIKRTRDAMILSRQSNLEAAESVQDLTAIMNVYGDEVKNTSNIVNKLSNVDANFAVSVQDLVQAFSRAGFSAKEAGVSFDEFASLVTVAQQNTARGGAVIGNAFKTIFANIQTKDVQNTMQRLGANFQDVNGKTLSGVRLLTEYVNRYKELMSQGNMTGANELTQKIGGTRQMNILLATAKGLQNTGSGKDFSDVMKVAEEVSNRAMQRNEEMNKSIADTFAQTKADLAEISELTSKLSFSQSIKSYLSTFKDLTDIAKKMLGDGEGEGNDFAKGIVSGISKTLSGPGMVVILGVITKLMLRTGGFIKDALKDLMGLNESLNQQKAIQQFITSLLTQNGELYNKINSSTLSQLEKEKLITSELQRQVGERSKIMSMTGSLSSGVINQGAFFKNNELRIKNLATGFLPIDKEQRDINNGVGGAKSTDKPRFVKDFNFGDGKIGPVVINSGEVLVRGVGHNGSDAVLNRNTANGVKNFAKGWNDPDIRNKYAGRSSFSSFEGLNLASDMGAFEDLRQNGKFASKKFERELKKALNIFLMDLVGAEKSGVEDITNQFLREQRFNGERLKNVLSSKNIENIKQTARNLNKIPDYIETTQQLAIRPEMGLMLHPTLGTQRSTLLTPGNLIDNNNFPPLQKYLSATLAEKRTRKNLSDISNANIGNISGEMDVRPEMIQNVRGTFKQGAYVGAQDKFNKIYVSRLTTLAKTQTLEEEFVEKVRIAVINGATLDSAVLKASEGMLQSMAGQKGARGKAQAIVEKNITQLAATEAEVSAETERALMEQKKEFAQRKILSSELDEQIKLQGIASRIMSGGVVSQQEFALVRERMQKEWIQQQTGTAMPISALSATAQERMNKEVDSRMMTSHLVAPASRIAPEKRNWLSSYMGTNEYENELARQQNQYYGDRLSKGNAFGLGKGYILDEQGNRIKGEENSRSARRARNRQLNGGQMSSWATFGAPIALSMASGMSEQWGASSIVSGGLSGAAIGVMLGGLAGPAAPIAMPVLGTIGALSGVFTNLKSVTEKQIELINKQINSMTRSSENYQSLIGLTNDLSDAMEGTDQLTRNRLRDEISSKILKVSDAGERNTLIGLMGKGNIEGVRSALANANDEENRKITSVDDRKKLLEFFEKNKSMWRSTNITPENRKDFEEALRSTYTGLSKSEGFDKDSKEFQDTEKFKNLDYDKLLKGLDAREKFKEKGLVVNETLSAFDNFRKYNPSITSIREGKSGALSYATPGGRLIGEKEIKAASEQMKSLAEFINLAGINKDATPEVIKSAIDKFKTISQEIKNLNSSNDAAVNSEKASQVIKNAIDEKLAKQNTDAFRTQSSNEIDQARRGYQIQSLSGYVSPMEETRQRNALSSEALSASQKEERRKMGIELMGGSTSKEIIKNIGFTSAPTEDIAKVQEMMDKYQKALEGGDWEKIKDNDFVNGLKDYRNKKLSSSALQGELGKDFDARNYQQADIPQILKNHGINISLTEQDIKDIQKGSYDNAIKVLSETAINNNDISIFNPMSAAAQQRTEQGQISETTQTEIERLRAKNLEEEAKINDRKEKLQLEFSQLLNKEQTTLSIRQSRAESVINLTNYASNFNSRYATNSETIPYKTGMIDATRNLDIKNIQDKYNVENITSAKEFLDNSSGIKNNLNNLFNNPQNTNFNLLNSSDWMRKKGLEQSPIESLKRSFENELSQIRKNPKDLKEIINKFSGDRVNISNNILPYISSNSEEYKQLNAILEKQKDYETSITSTIDNRIESRDEEIRKIKESAEQQKNQLDLEQKYNESIASGMASASAKLRELAENKAAIGESFINGLQGAGTGFMDSLVRGERPGKAALQGLLGISESIRKPITDQAMGNLVSGAHDKGYFKWLPEGMGQSPNAVTAPLTGISAAGGTSSALQELTAAALRAATALGNIGGDKTISPAAAGAQPSGGESSGIWSSIWGGIKSMFTSSTGNGYHNGGIIGYANGGGIDTVPMVGENGEYVINKKAARAIGYNKLAQLNHYADGGSVSFSGYSGDLLTAIDDKKIDSKKNYEAQLKGLQGSGMSQKFWHGNSPTAKAYWTKESKLFASYKQKLADRAARQKELKDLAISTAVNVGMSYGGSRFNSYMSQPSQSAKNYQNLKNNAEYYNGSAAAQTNASVYDNPNYKYNYNNVMAATGGLINQGDYGIDKVPAMVTRGEYVVKKSVVDRLGSQYFDNINNRYAGGGLVNSTSTSSTSSSSLKLDININGDKTSDSTDTKAGQVNVDQLKTVMKQAAQEEIRKQMRVGGALRGANR